MVRKSKAPPMPENDVVDTEKLEQGTASLVLASGNASQVATLMDYTLAYNRDRIVQEARFYMATSAEAMLEAGKRLVLLKENEPHGEFVQVVEEQLGIPVRTAQQMMQAAVKYLTNPALSSKAQALALLGKTKLFELMTLDDDDLIELAEGGSVANIKLEDIDRMSVRELKAALREQREETAATQAVLADKSKKIDKLETALQRQKAEEPAPEWSWASPRRHLLDAAESVANYIQTELRRALVIIRDQAEKEGTLPEDMDALQGNALSSVMQSLVALQKDFNLSVDLESVVVPAWMQDGSDQT